MINWVFNKKEFRFMSQLEFIIEDFGGGESVMFLIMGHLVVCYVLCFCWVAELLVCWLKKLS
jgi:hypothetical protein